MVDILLPGTMVGILLPGTMVGIPQGERPLRREVYIRVRDLCAERYTLGYTVGRGPCAIQSFNK